MIYILFVLTVGGGITTAEFNSRFDCQLAALEASDHGIRGFDSGVIDSWCVAKGIKYE